MVTYVMLKNVHALILNQPLAAEGVVIGQNGVLLNKKWYGKL